MESQIPALCVTKPVRGLPPPCDPQGHPHEVGGVLRTGDVEWGGARQCPQEGTTQSFRHIALDDNRCDSTSCYTSTYVMACHEVSWHCKICFCFREEEDKWCRTEVEIYSILMTSCGVLPYLIAASGSHGLCPT